MKECLTKACQAIAMKRWTTKCWLTSLTCSIPTCMRKISGSTYAVYDPKKKELDSKHKRSADIKAQLKFVHPQSEMSIIAKQIVQDAQKTNSQHNLQVLRKQATVEQFSQKIEGLKTNMQKIEMEIPDKPLTYSLKDVEYAENNWLKNLSKTVEFVTFDNKQKDGLQIKPSPLLGTEDPNIPPSKVPCVGCGAHLQCQHNTFPGFLPSEYFKIHTEKDLKSTLCQRCYYIRHCEAFKEVTTNPKEFAEIISKIRPTKSLVVMVVDLMDINGSIVPNLMQYIGFQHEVIVVGNKADLLCPDTPDYLVNVTHQLQKACADAGVSKIRKCTLISAKTGFGIERLISTLLTAYKKKVDVFIVGTANAGKSSLFNALLASDYCKHTARDLIERATISVWPGTTLNLLKFPIMRPSSHNFTLRVIRLKQEEAMRKEERRIKHLTTMSEKEKVWQLKGDVRTTDIRNINQRQADETVIPWGQNIAALKVRSDGTVKLIESEKKSQPFEEEAYSESYWTYDTPGVINPNQIINMLTPEEAPLLAPAQMLVPQSLIFKPGETVFVSGLARMDFLESDDSVLLTVHCGPKIPIHVIPTTEADEFYAKNVGTHILGLPIGNKDRLLKLPSLVGNEFSVNGVKDKLAVADIQLSSLGWISIAPNGEKSVKMRAYTPGGIGLFLRMPALLPFHTSYKGKRIAGTPFFETRPPGWIMSKKKIDIPAIV
ncbi:nitric oxide-associated protein 1-like [Physella acuta]|uniref:nitric oxide-associated protein 1-like n=1 Tax=Physella acuta TaxID=109671 RepID=UPI0027DBBE9E|nr:nitric oxide-associated protein 1-like [Physella acuta]XP_059157084.1 nitric oxide-associated protein 1-like [Physella acuta]XP_059157085.1 nitric oxide-associated protein 1-like [Physella acuta]